MWIGKPLVSDVGNGNQSHRHHINNELLHFNKNHYESGSMIDIEY